VKTPLPSPLVQKNPNRDQKPSQLKPNTLENSARNLVPPKFQHSTPNLTPFQTPAVTTLLLLLLLPAVCEWWKTRLRLLWPEYNKKNVQVPECVQRTQLWHTLRVVVVVVVSVIVVVVTAFSLYFALQII